MSVSVWILFSHLILWGTLVLYSLATLVWIFEVSILSPGWKSDDTDKIGLDNIQIRVLTISAEATVQATVDAIPDEISRAVVIAEEQIDIDGAGVHVVPKDFECDAQQKGRALEFGRQTIRCDEEYILYLDEDSLLGDLTGLPDGDIIQLSEHPLRTGSRITYLCEIFRIGFQFEQRAFHQLSRPSYAWGGGVAIRKEIEEKITWDFPSVTEDTTFIWLAATQFDLDYRLTRTRVRNQAPPTIMALLKQRRRWLSGTIQDIDILPYRYRVFVLTRIVIWGLSPIVPIIVTIAYAFPGLVPSTEVYILLSFALLGILPVYMMSGLLEYRKPPEAWILYLLGTPIAVVIQSLGALWGLVNPVDEFSVTKKTALVDKETVKELNEVGDLE